MTLRARALHLLLLTDADQKARETQLFDLAQPAGAGDSLVAPEGIPGRPARPVLVPHTQLRRGSLATPHGHATLLHAVAHIEFNAINLALDAVWRFAGMPDQYYLDWARVAREEAYHFGLMRDHLATLGFAYGDFPAHDALWRMTERTSGDLLARMALVPRTLEARGLDASPPMQAKLRGIGDVRGVEILGIILRDEIGHVAVGNRWYRWLCERAGLDPVPQYELLASRYEAPRPQPPFNEAARRQAGFSEDELARLASPPRS
ncbi:ferritin-like domain-containing protein [Ramlibacter sp.]|uniref:ferritin-like domain-containing protein n=1 Tax=Ramlibacter sp. TaxID=1917967 RepID=UPI002CA11D4C|nr:ferritin-like domain-containing protein [Ramlibacter sp.]HWI83602.1 ferritin-like domain-containing protein [Ramlibacter sp.]